MSKTQPVNSDNDTDVQNANRTVDLDHFRRRWDESTNDDGEFYVRDELIKVKSNERTLFYGPIVDYQCVGVSIVGDRTTVAYKPE